MRRLLFVLFLATDALANQAVITTTDYSSGALSSLDLGTNTPAIDHLTIHSDAAVRVYRDRVYVLNRLGQDNVIVLDRGDLATPLTQYSTGNGSNPHDIAFVSEEKAYISRYERTQLLIVNPVTGDSLGSVDLSTFADADGLPETSQLALYGGHLFAVCHRLDRENGWVPTEFSTIAVIDVKTDQLVDADPAAEGTQGIEMTSKNPAGAARRGSKWIVNAVNTYSDLTDGGIEVIDLTTLRSEGVVLDEAAVGGNLSSLVMTSDSDGYAVVTDENFVNTVKRLDLAMLSVSPGLSGLSGGFVPGLGVFGQRLYVLDQGSFGDPASAGIKVYDVSTDALVAGPISTGLPPSSIAFVGSVADFDGDCVVDFSDFLAFASAFGRSAGDDDFDGRFDLNGNDEVDFQDFLIFASEFGGG
ncbi:MAG: hypothetical protein OXU79_18700 [Gemmatimonadota bacterium]|nr:hypothetical protein [Gemmatimonadota bacterium]